MIRLAILLAILLFPSAAIADFGVAGGGIGQIYVYGDSYNDDEEIWTNFFQTNTVMERDRFWTASSGGARAAHNDTTGTFGCASGAPSAYTYCKGFVELQVLYLDGACRVDYSTAGNDNNRDGKTGSTCIADRDIGPNDICVFVTGTNDVNQGSPVSWDGTYRPQTEAGTLRILNEFDRVGCPTVVSSSVPLIRGAPSNFYRTDLRVSIGTDGELNAAAYAAWLKDEVETNRSNMVFVDMRAAFNTVATVHGEAAFLSLYDCQGGRGSDYVASSVDPTECADGAHPHYSASSILGYSGRDLQAQLMAQAMLRLREATRLTPTWIGN
tara:strand:- start:681 stop:1658 length:978 start_codon:yes stop_codon:yes gene_type:complete